ncbi:hypothetical protein L2Y94_08660 [Luteibacter aegosomatis]|uniref:hypothetical protein n=1 Tax=Luteibacter aegosomatis TaxID=2911537 RepID=UPI001FF86C04|nr:hypothetical protein [Luteibacter aegosomatis]UPG87408.1 hypothetical protein L2Y94_08660 [Luteibacter aegosomatis]
MKAMLMGIALAAVATAGFSGAAKAVPPASRSVKYFDEFGNLVGQQYLLCSGIAKHGGNIHTAYHIEEATSCPSGGDEGWIVPGKIVVAYTLPSSLTIDAACSIASCQGSYVPEVNVLGLWPYSVGYQ